MEKSTTIIWAIQSLTTLITTLFLLWKNHEKKRASPAIRILRKKKEIEKTKIDNHAKMEKLQLELKNLEEEANYQSRMNKWESGEWNPPVFNKNGEINLTKQSNIGEKISGLTSKLGDIKTQGQEIIQKGVKQFDDLKNKGVENLNSLKNKSLEKIKKLSEKIKEHT